MKKKKLNQIYQENQNKQINLKNQNNLKRDL